jgi:hypothetical protein
MRYPRLLALATAVGVVLVPRAAAQGSPNFLYPRFEAGLSGTLLVLGTKIRIDTKGNPQLGTEVDAEDVLGISRTSFEPRVGVRWRPWRRHEIEAAFLRAVRSGEKTLQRTIVVGDNSFVLGTRINTALRTSQAFLTYRYAFTARDRTQIGAALGIGVLYFRMQLDRLAGITGDTVSSSQTSETHGPSGSVGLYGRFQLGDRWYFESDLRGIYTEIENYEITIVEAGAAGRYFFSRVVGAELGYDLGYYSEVEQRTGKHFLGLDFTGKVTYLVQGFRGGLVIQF